MSPYRPIAASRNSFESPSRAEYSAATVYRAVFVFAHAHHRNQAVSMVSMRRSKNGANFQIAITWLHRKHRRENSSAVLRATKEFERVAIRSDRPIWGHAPLPDLKDLQLAAFSKKISNWRRFLKDIQLAAFSKKTSDWRRFVKASDWRRFLKRLKSNTLVYTVDREIFA